MFGLENFKASRGWLDRFRFRNAISFKRLHGEAAEIDDDALRQWQENELWTALERYTADQIYNADETGVFFRCYRKIVTCLKVSF
jgi:hypothetical protein